jgi:hypothetical protein
MINFNERGQGQRNLIFQLGIAFFFLTRFYLLLVTTLYSGIPRLGDDALVYLWHSKLPYLEAPEKIPALKSTILEQSTAVDLVAIDQVPPIAVRTVGGMNFISDFVNASFHYFGLDLKWTFFLSELLGLGLMSLAFALFLREIFGAPAAGIGMGLLAFAIFPNQGIYSYIPSTLALSSAILLWVYILNRQANASIFIVGLIAFVVSQIHPIGRIYALLSIPLYFLNQEPKIIVKNAKVWLLVAVVAGSVLAGIGIKAYLTAYMLPSLSGPPGGFKIIVIGGLVENIKSALICLWDPWLRKNSLLVVLFFLGLIYSKKVLTNPQKYLLVFSTIILVGSLLHYLPGYPAELFSRLLVPFSILASGVAGSFLYYQWDAIRFKNLFRIFVIFCFIVTCTLFVTKYGFSKINERPEHVDERAFQKLLATFPDNIRLYYFNSITLFQEALLLGGGRLSSIHHEYMELPSVRQKLLKDIPPDYFLALYPDNLNSISAGKLKSFVRPRYGLHLGLLRKVELEVPTSTEKIEMHVDNAGPAFDLEINSQKINVPELFVGWISLPDCTAPNSKINVQFRRVNAWIDGIRLGNEKNDLSWPWNDELKMIYYYRNPRKMPKVVLFGLNAFLDGKDALFLKEYMSDRPFISDKGGILLLKSITTWSSFNNNFSPLIIP